MGLYQLRVTQNIPATKHEVWDFISSPANLQRITPDKMGFEITASNLSPKMYEGMIIAYKVKPILNIPMTWVTEITHVDKGNYFVDEQRLGPYKIWHHEHHIKEIEGGIQMLDIISYTPPFGIIGKLANTLFIQRQLNGIFEYRKKALIEIFGKYV
jgi:ligand-binding SRPBCC domain-containing protein